MLAQDLPIYRQTFDFVALVINVCTKFPKAHRYHLGSSLYDTSLSLFSLIETYNRNYGNKALRVECLNGFLVKLNTIDTFVRLGVQLRCISISEQARLNKYTQEIGKQATSLKNKTLGESLFTCGEGLGLPIGNLSSQVLANFYLSDFDIMMSRMFEGMYGRYVDDYYVISESKEKILSSIELAREFLSRYGVTLHPKKVYIQHYSKGIKFIGATIKFGRTYVNNSTLHHFKRCINEINSIKDKETYALKAVQRLNSYLGYLRQFLTYGIRIQIIKTLSPEWRRYIYVTGNCKKMVLRTHKV